jgi:hypothetical protein
MKKNCEIINMPNRQLYEYSGIEPLFSQEFIESEENEENSFFCFPGDERYDQENFERRKMNS